MPIKQETMIALIHSAQHFASVLEVFQDAIYEKYGEVMQGRKSAEDAMNELFSLHRQIKTEKKHSDVLSKLETHYKLMATKNYRTREYARRRAEGETIPHRVTRADLQTKPLVEVADPTPKGHFPRATEELLIKLLEEVNHPKVTSKPIGEARAKPKPAVEPRAESASTHIVRGSYKNDKGEVISYENDMTETFNDEDILKGPFGG